MREEGCGTDTRRVASWGVCDRCGAVRDPHPLQGGPDQDELSLCSAVAPFSSWSASESRVSIVLGLLPLGPGLPNGSVCLGLRAA